MHFSYSSKYSKTKKHSLDFFIYLLNFLYLNISVYIIKTSSRFFIVYFFTLSPYLLIYIKVLSTRVVLNIEGSF